MRKFRYIAIVFGLMLAVSGYSQTSISEHLLFQGTFYKSFFPNGKLAFSNYANTTYLNIVALGAAWEQPIWKGLGYLGLEAGYSSGSKFGGKSSMDFVPIMVNAGYDFLLGDFFSIGPNLKLGGFGLFTPIGDKFVPLIAAHLEGEFRYKPFPLSLYAAGGVDFFPTVSGALPAMEVGMRFRPFSFKRSGSSEKPAASGTASSGQSAGQSEATAPAAGAPAASTAQTLVDSAGATAPAASTAPAATAPAASTAQAPAAGTAPAATTPPPAAAAVAPPPATVTATTPPAASTAQAPAAGTAPAATTPPPAAAAVAPPPATVTATTPPAAAAATPPPATVTATTPPPAGSTTPPPVVAASPQSSRQPLGGTPIRVDGRQGYLRSVYFQPDSGVLIETSRPELDAVGREMSADSALRLILRAYTTPAKTAEGRLMVSRERADFCRDYLTSRYNIAANRITSFYYGSESMPVRATEDDWESQRCVELVIIE